MVDAFFPDFLMVERAFTKLGNQRASGTPGCDQTAEASPNENLHAAFAEAFLQAMEQTVSKTIGFNRSSRIELGTLAATFADIVIGNSVV